MPSNLTDVDEFTDPATAPADGDAGNAATFAPPHQKAANRTRNLVNRLGGADGSGEWKYRNGSGVDAPKSRIKELGFSALGAGADGWTRAATTYIASLKNTYDGCFVIDLPSGCIITGWKVIVKPGAARSGADRMVAQLASWAPDYAASPPTNTLSTHGSSPSDDGTTNVQTLSQTLGSPVTIDRSTRSYALRVFSGNDGATNPDRVYACQVLFTDPGPRNA